LLETKEKDGVVGAMNYKNYTDYYKKKLNQGLEYQDFISDIFYENGIIIVAYSSKCYQNERGENRIGIEIKNDAQFEKTGNIYIEIAEKSNPKNESYVMSGIYRNDNSWLYAIGNYKIIFIFGKETLKILHKLSRYKEVKTPTSKGFLIPNKDAKKYALKIIEIKK
jgi:hypothetical protein